MATNAKGDVSPNKTETRPAALYDASGKRIADLENQLGKIVYDHEDRKKATAWYYGESPHFRTDLMGIVKQFFVIFASAIASTSDQKFSLREAFADLSRWNDPEKGYEPKVWEPPPPPKPSALDNAAAAKPFEAAAAPTITQEAKTPAHAPTTPGRS